MMARCISFFSLFLLMISMGFKVNAKDDDSPAYVRYVDEVTCAFLNEMYKEYGFECGASGGSMPHDVQEISVKLIAYQSATVEEAREWVIKATERFAQIINAHEKIRPFLREYPFPSSRADVAISFRNPKKSFSLSTKNNVAYVLQARNKIYYQAENPNNPYMYRDIKDESYAEALKIVQSNAAKKASKPSQNL